MASRSKKHHYLPVGFQKRFVEGHTQLFYSKRNKEGRFERVEARNPSNIFFKRNHNTRYENGHPTDIVERSLYANVDDQLCKIVDEIRPLVRSRENFEISEDSDFTLRIILIEMMRRVPESQRDFITNYRSQLKSTEMKMIERFPDKETEIRKAVGARYSDPLEMQNVGVEIRTGYPERLLEGMEGMQFRFACLPDNAMFILSSNMIQRLSNGGSGNLHDKATELWFPIDPHIAIVAARVPQKFPQFIEMNRKFAKDYNDLAIQRSDEVGSPCHKLLAALTRRRMA